MRNKDDDYKKSNQALNRLLERLEQSKINGICLDPVKKKGLEILTRVYLHLKDKAEKIQKEYADKKTEGERIDVIQKFHAEGLYPMGIVNKVGQDSFKVDLDQNHEYLNEFFKKKY